MPDWKSVIEAHERHTEIRAKYEDALSHLIESKNIGAFQALQIMSGEVERAHDAVVAALASIWITKSERAGDQSPSGRPGRAVKDRHDRSRAAPESQRACNSKTSSSSERAIW